MAAENGDGDGVPWSWIVLFVLLALGVAVWAIFFVGGDLTGPGVLVP